MLAYAKSFLQLLSRMIDEALASLYNLGFCGNLVWKKWDRYLTTAYITIWAIKKIIFIIPLIFVVICLFLAWNDFSIHFWSINLVLILSNTTSYIDFYQEIMYFSILMIFDNIIASFYSFLFYSWCLWQKMPKFLFINFACHYEDWLSQKY